MWHLPTLSSTSSSLGTSPIATTTSSSSTSANHSQDLSSVSSTSVTSSETTMQSPPSVKDEFSSNNSYAAADYRQILILETLAVSAIIMDLEARFLPYFGHLTNHSKENPL